MHYHLIGIAGSGMRSLAHILLDIGWAVRGSDTANDALDDLVDRGAEIFPAHDAENLLHGTDLVVFSDAIPADNSELELAGRWKITTLRYFQALGVLAARRRTRLDRRSRLGLSIATAARHRARADSGGCRHPHQQRSEMK